MKIWLPLLLSCLQKLFPMLLDTKVQLSRAWKPTKSLHLHGLLSLSGSQQQEAHMLLGCGMCEVGSAHLNQLHKAHPVLQKGMGSSKASTGRRPDISLPLGPSSARQVRLVQSTAALHAPGSLYKMIWKRIMFASKGSSSLLSPICWISTTLSGRSFCWVVVISVLGWGRILVFLKPAVPFQMVEILLLFSPKHVMLSLPDWASFPENSKLCYCSSVVR